jgi:propanol-preferring alcohol dehydrogenase
LSLIAQFGTLVCVGVPPPTQLVNFHPLHFVANGIRIIGSAVGTRGDILEALEFVQQGVVKTTVNVTQLENLIPIANDFAKVML